MASTGTIPIFRGNTWTNPGEVAGNGLDDDNNGYVDDIHGWDFLEGNNDPSNNAYHGTNCAGIIGAVGDNGVGVTGVMHQVRLMPLKVGNWSPSVFDTAAEIIAISYARNKGIKIISCSFGGYSPSTFEQEAIEATDALFVCSAGNKGINTDVTPHYPSGYPSANIISVAATDNRDRLRCLLKLRVELG